MTTAVPPRRIYMDYNATAPLRPQALRAVCDALAVGNASSIHAEGRAARAIVERARRRVAALVGVPAKCVVLASGGTEAANLMLTPQFFVGGERRPLDRLLAAAVEHPCVLKGHRFADNCVSALPVAPDGTLDLAALDAALSAGGRAMLALQLANNETGVIQPVAEAAALVHAHDGVVVCDAVQAAGKVHIDLPALGADAIVVSAHKFGGPKGAGALVFADERSHIGSVPLRGGGQERGLRAGTENVAAIAGFGAACEAGADIDAESARLAHLRDRLAERLRAIVPDAVVFGQTSPRLPNTVAFAVEAMRAETVLIGLDLAGVAVSSGSACSSGKVARSPVLEAMGVPAALAAGALRLSLGWASTMNDVEGFAAAFEAVAANMRGRRRAAA